MTRTELTEKIVLARIAKGLTWKALAEATGRSEVWTTSALLPGPKGDRVKITMNGKFLAYRKW